jgi:hypothetical protein
MFENVGSKIKGLASFFCWGGIIASVVGGIWTIALLDEDFILLGLLIIALGSLLSWVSSFVLYGFGELVSNSAIIAGKTTANESEQGESAFVPQEKNKKIASLNSLKARGLITDEEYNKKLAELENEI